MDFQITDIAREKLLQYKENSIPIKVKLTSKSWCGFIVSIVSEEQYQNEKIYNTDGIDIIVAEDLEDFIKGIKIDYYSNFLKKKFKITPTFK